MISGGQSLTLMAFCKPVQTTSVRDVIKPSGSSRLRYMRRMEIGSNDIQRPRTLEASSRATIFLYAPPTAQEPKQSVCTPPIFHQGLDLRDTCTIERRGSSAWKSQPE